MLMRAVMMCLLLASAAAAQMAPVVNPRGVRNEFSLRPAPAAAAPGSLVRVTGINLGGPESWKAQGAPLPTEVGTPPVQVLINNRAAGLAEVSPGAIVCQVPEDLPPGQALLVVKRGEAQSRAARFELRRLAPVLRSLDGSGFGAAEAAREGTTVRLRAMGLGQEEPVRVLLDGVPAVAATAPAAERPGEVEIRLEEPAGAQPGDMVQLVAGGVLGNLLTYGRQGKSSVAWLRLPEELADLKSVVQPDLRSGLAVASGARTTEGCYPSWIMDFGKESVTPMEGCPTAANRQAVTAFVPVLNTGLLTAFLGPVEDDPTNGISPRLRIVNPQLAGPLDVVLPFAAAGVAAQPDGQILALGPGGNSARVNVETGELSEGPPLLPGPGTGGATGAIQTIVRDREIDLGDGVKRKVLSGMPRQLVAQMAPLVVADDAAGTQNPKAVFIDLQGQVQLVKEFPQGWQPLVPPTAPPPPSQGGPAPALSLVPADVDAATRLYYAVSKSEDGTKHGVVAFPANENPARVVEFPEGWYVSACTNNIAVFPLELTQRLALFGTKVRERQFRAQCTARGFVEFDLRPQGVTRAFELPGQGEFNVTGGANEINDFLYGTDADPVQRGASSTMFVFDSATEAVFRMDLPGGVASFMQPRPFAELNLVVAMARERVPGDQGIVLFDLEKGEAQLLPTPADFDTMQFLSIMPGTLKLVAKGMRSGGSGSQYLIFDLLTRDLEMVANPERVVWVGAAQGATIAGERVNPKSNSVMAVGFDAERKAAGLMLIKIQ
ncbi:MAG: hypothetical protein HZB13_16220 [Acidobacteria bacterium]|nr:hypothetical protein [Acidobacteriota bacterium]